MSKFANTINNDFFLLLVLLIIKAFFLFYHHYNWLGLVIQLTDMFLVTSIILMFCYLCTLMIVLMFAFTYFYCNLFKYISKKYTKIGKMEREKQKLVNMKFTYNDKIETRSIITQCFYQHTVSLLSIFYIDKIIISPGLYTVTVATLVFSTYMIGFIWFQKLPPHFRFMLNVVWLFDTIYYIIGILIIARLNEEIIKSAKPYYYVLSILDRKYLHIWKRWKILTYYELLNRKEKPLLINIGPLGNLTRNKVFEVSLYFFSFFI